MIITVRLYPIPYTIIITIITMNLLHEVLLLMVLLALLLPINSQTTSSCAIYAQSDQCSHCHQQYYLATNYTCIPCPTGCLQCISPHICLDCLTGFYLVNRLCLPATPHCLTTNTTGSCSACLLGYELIKGECRSCPDYCAECQIGMCSNCTFGFGLRFSKDSRPLCLVCGGNCAQCSWSQGEPTCSLCFSTFYLSSANHSCLPCPSSCVSCQRFGCHSCMVGYYLTAMTC